MMFVPATQGEAFYEPHLESRRRLQRDSCFPLALRLEINRGNQKYAHTTAALILIRYPGWIRTAVIISLQVNSWSRRISTISKGKSAAAPTSWAWAPTIKATESHLAHLLRTTDLWRGNTSRVALRRPERSPTYD